MSEPLPASAGSQLNKVAWTDFFSRTVSQLTGSNSFTVSKRTKSNPANDEKLSRVLNNTERLLKGDCFTYPNLEKEKQGKFCLLTIWDKLLDLCEDHSTIFARMAKGEELDGQPITRAIVKAFVDPPCSRDRTATLITTVLGLLPFLARRYEFDLIHLLRPRSTTKAFFTTFTHNEEQLAHMRRYQTLLLRTTLLTVAVARETQLIKVVNVSESVGGKLNSTRITQHAKHMGSQPPRSMPPELAKFCSEVLALAYFRLPMFSTTVLIDAVFSVTNQYYTECKDATRRKLERKQRLACWHALETAQASTASSYPPTDTATIPPMPLSDYPAHAISASIEEKMDRLGETGSLTEADTPEGLPVTLAPPSPVPESVGMATEVSPFAAAAAVQQPSAVSREHAGNTTTDDLELSPSSLSDRNNSPVRSSLRLLRSRSRLVPDPSQPGGRRGSLTSLGSVEMNPRESPEGSESALDDVLPRDDVFPRFHAGSPSAAPLLISMRALVPGNENSGENTNEHQEGSINSDSHPPHASELSSIASELLPSVSDSSNTPTNAKTVVSPSPHDPLKAYDSDEGLEDDQPVLDTLPSGNKTVPIPMRPLLGSQAKVIASDAKADGPLGGFFLELGTIENDYFQRGNKEKDDGHNDVHDLTRHPFFKGTGMPPKTEKSQAEEKKKTTEKEKERKKMNYQRNQRISKLVKGTGGGLAANLAQDDISWQLNALEAIRADSARVRQEMSRSDRKEKADAKKAKDEKKAGKSSTQGLAKEEDAQAVKQRFLAWNPGFFEWGLPEMMNYDETVLNALLAPQAQLFLKHQFAEPAFLLEMTALWLVHVQAAAHGAVLWQVLPGYSMMLEAALSCMIHFPHLLATNAGRRVQSLLLSHDSPSPQRSPAVLRAFVETRLHQTNFHDPAAFNATIDMVDEWIRLCAGDDLAAPLPENFCFESLVLAIETALSGHHFQVLIKILTFLYMHAGRFYLQRRELLFEGVLLRRVIFLPLFLHWCPEVRRVFQLLLTYRVLRSKHKEYGLGSLIFDCRLLPKADAGPVIARPADGKNNSKGSSPSSSTSKDGGRDLRDKRPRPNPEKDQQSKGGLSTIIREVFSLWGQRSAVEASVLCDGDPALETCVIVKTEMGRPELNYDGFVVCVLNKYIKLVQECSQAERGYSPLIPLELAPYASDALTEFNTHIQSFHRLQTHRQRTKPETKPSELLVPLLYFQIATKHQSD